MRRAAKKGGSGWRRIERLPRECIAEDVEDPGLIARVSAPGREGHASIELAGEMDDAGGDGGQSEGDGREVNGEKMLVHDGGAGEGCSRAREGVEEFGLARVAEDEAEVAEAGEKGGRGFERSFVLFPRDEVKEVDALESWIAGEVSKQD